MLLEKLKLIRVKSKYCTSNSLDTAQVAKVERNSLIGSGIEKYRYSLYAVYYKRWHQSPLTCAVTG